jgi:hypothetical protein
MRLELKCYGCKRQRTVGTDKFVMNAGHLVKISVTCSAGSVISAHGILGGADCVVTTIIITLVRTVA